MLVDARDGAISSLPLRQLGIERVVVERLVADHPWRLI